MVGGGGGAAETSKTAAGGFELAEFNVARLRAPLDHPDTAEFVANLDAVNTEAEAAPGFVWRLTDESGQSSSYVVAYDDPLMIINYSIWASPNDLHAFVFKTMHAQFLRRRREWFQAVEAAILVCWWIPAGQRPPVAEAQERLERLRRDGPTADAFTLRHRFPPPGASTASDADGSHLESAAGS